MLKTIIPPTPVLVEDLGIIPTPSGKEKRRYGIYKCHCGNVFKAEQYKIKSGNTKSCGCFQKKQTSNATSTHGLRSHSIYRTWTHIKDRCCNINDKSYINYGGRGIKVCDRWKESFENFRDDMFESWSKGLTIDRINNDGNYEPSNCRWVSRNIQSQNTRKICKNNTSGYRGVIFHKKANKWVAQIGVNLKHKHIGCFNTALEAAKAYDTYIIENHLEHTINGV